MVRHVELKKPIFIVGLHRTGSTLLKNALAANSVLAMATDEMEIASPWRRTLESDYRSFGDMKHDVVASAFLDHVFSGKVHGTFWKDYLELEVDQSAVRAEFMESDRSLASLITIMLEAYRQQQGRLRVGVKYPLHFSYIDRLYRWYPDSRVIFLTRDARAVCASKVNDEATRRRKANHPLLAFAVHYMSLLFFAFEYIWSVRFQQKFMARENFLTVRYEVLVEDPLTELKRICDFCQIEMEPQMLDASGKASSFSGESKPGFDSSRTEKWKTRLGRVDRWLVTSLTSHSMKVLGYTSQR